VTGPAGGFLATPAAGGRRATLLLAHGAGGPMDSPALEAFAAAVAAAGVAVLRFEFPYMAARRTGARKPPPKAETLVPAYRRALEAALADTDGPLLIGGKSLGGRVAAMTAGETLEPRVRGVVAYGYPFHPPGEPGKTRLPPLQAARLPVLVLQGTRDPFGGKDEVATYDVGPRAEVAWFEDGDHDLKPRRASGETMAGHLATAARRIAAFAARLA